MADIDKNVSELYVAFFGRPAEPVGAQFWDDTVVSRREAGENIDAIEQELAARFADVDEATSRYSFLADPETGDPGQFIDDVYQNLFNRTAEAAGKSFWENRFQDLLDNGTSVEQAASRFVLEILNAAQDDDAVAVQNKVDTATEFSNRYIETGAVFTSPDDLQPARDLIADVGASDASRQQAQTRLDEIIDANTADTGVVVDGYLENATVWADQDGDGVQDPDEPTATTNDQGRFTFTDAQGNEIDVGGTVFARGGVDTTTGLAFDGTLSGSEGAKVVSPVTALVQQVQAQTGGSAADAEAQVKRALGIDDNVDLNSFDPVATLADSSASNADQDAAVRLQAVTTQVVNVSALAGNAAGGATGLADLGQANDAALSAIADAIARAGADETVDLSSEQAVSNIIQDTLSRAQQATGQSLDADRIDDILDNVGEIARNANARVSETLSEGGDPSAVFAQIARIQKVAQGDGAESVRTGAENNDLGTARDQFTGGNFDNRVGDTDVTLPEEAPAPGPGQPGGGGGSGGGGAPADPAPAVSAFARDGDSPTNSDSLVFDVQFDEAVVNVDAADFTVVGGSSAEVASVSGSGESRTVTVSGGDLAGIDSTTVGLNLADNQDIADTDGNALPDDEPATDESYVVDNRAPEIDAVSVINSGEVRTGETIEVRVRFDSEMAISGTPEIALAIGDETRVATFEDLVDDGTVATFTYQVQADDGDGDGIAVQSPLTGGTVTDVAGNPLASGVFAAPSTGDVTVNVTRGGAADPLISGATVFADSQDTGNVGELDAGEPVTTTGSAGEFQLTGVTDPLILEGGRDIATGAAFDLRLEAPAGYSVITPLTTLIKNIGDLSGNTVSGAESGVASNVGLAAGFAFADFDPFAAANANAVTYQKAAASLGVFASVASEALAAQNGTDRAQESVAAFDALAEASQALDLSAAFAADQASNTAVEDLLRDAGLNTDVAATADEINAATRAIEAVSGGDATAQLTEIARIQRNVAEKRDPTNTDNTDVGVVAPSVVSVSADTPRVDEGGAGEQTALTFSVSRSGDTSRAATVDYTVQGGSNLTPDDFTGGPGLPQGRVSFDPGQTQADITISVAGDDLREDDESFTVVLDNAGAGTRIAGDRVSATIVNDDPTTPVQSVPAELTGSAGQPTSLTGPSIDYFDPSATLTTNVTATNGEIGLVQAGGATALSGTQLVLTGTRSAVNQSLQSLVFVGEQGNDTGSVTLNTSVAGRSDSDDIAIDIQNAPVNTLPGSPTVTAQTPSTISGLSVADVDGDALTVELDPAQGTVAVTDDGGASVGAIDGDALRISGTASEVNAALSNLTFTGAAGSTSGGITVTTSDGARRDQDTLSVDIEAARPSLTVADTSLVASENNAVDIGGIQVADRDSDVTVTLTATNGTVTAAGPATVENSGTGTVTVSGAPEAVNDSLNTLAFTATATQAVSLEVEVADGDTQPVSETIDFSVEQNAPPRRGGDLTLAAVNEDAGATTLTLDPQQLSDPEGTPGSIRILTVEGGSLDGVTPGADSTPVSLGTNGADLSFTPAADREADASITYAVVDPADPALVSAPSTATVPINAINDAPSLTTQSFGVREGARFTLGSAQLGGTDVEQGPGALEYTLTDKPDDGDLLRDGSLLANGGTFTQQQVNAGELTYRHNGADDAQDSFAVSLVDGAGDSAGPETVDVDVSTVNDAPTATVDDLTVGEGERGDLAAALESSDEEQGPAARVYTVTAAPVVGGLFVDDDNDGEQDADEATLGDGDTFTEADIGNVVYAHDGSETSADRIGLQLSDGTNVVNGLQVDIDVTPTNDAPSLDLNGGNAGVDSSAVTEASTATAFASAARVLDPDNSDQAPEAQIESLSVTGEDNGTVAASASAQAAIQSAGLSLDPYSDGNGDGIQVTGSATATTYQQILRGLTFTDSQTGQTTLTVTLSDGSAPAQSASANVAVQVGFLSRSNNEVTVEATAPASPITIDLTADTVTTPGGEVPNTFQTIVGAADVDAGAANGSVTVIGTDGVNTLTGSAQADRLEGAAGDDTLTAGDGDDTLVGGPGADTLDGGGGFDTVLLRGQASDYTLSFDSNGELTGVTRNSNATSVSDSLTNVEQVAFADSGRAGVGVTKAVLLPTSGAGRAQQFEDIQGAVDAANAGDTVLLGPGSFDGGFEVNGKDDLTIRGTGQTTINGQAGDAAVVDVANSDGVVLRDFAVDAGGATRGVRFENTDGADRSGAAKFLSISGFDQAGIVATGTGLTADLSRNEVTGAGLRAGETATPQIGIEVSSGAGGTVSGNTVSAIGGDRGDVSASLVQLASAASGTSVTGNTLEGVFDGSDPNSAIGVSVTGTAGAAVETNDVSGVLEGVRIAGGSATPSVSGNSYSQLVQEFDSSTGETLAGANVNLRGEANSSAINFTASDGPDALVGSDQADELDAGAGQDVLAGGGSGDRLTGGAGADTFVIRTVSESAGSDPDTITDFDAGAGDAIDLTDVPLASDPSQVLSGVADGPADNVADFFDDDGTDRAIAFATDGADGQLFVDVDGDGDWAAASDIRIDLSGRTTAPAADAVLTSAFAVPNGQVSVLPNGSAANAQTFGSVQAAVDAATAGDKVLLGAGTFNGFSVDAIDDLTVVGQGDSTTIQGIAGAEAAVDIAESPGLVLENLSVDANGAVRGVRIENQPAGAGGAGSARVADLTISGFTQAGLVGTGRGLSTDFEGNTVIGAGLQTAASATPQIGIELSAQASGTIHNNVVREIGGTRGDVSATLINVSKGDTSGGADIEIVDNELVGLFDNQGDGANSAIGVSLNGVDLVGDGVSANTITGVLEGIRLADVNFVQGALVENNIYSQLVQEFDASTGETLAGANVNLRGEANSSAISFTASDGPDVLVGSNQADTLDGAAGKDILAGGGSGDTLTGGNGGDTFVIRAVTESDGNAPDTITDFVSGTDAIGVFFDTSALTDTASVLSKPDSAFDPSATVTDFFDDGTERAFAFASDGTDGQLFVDANGNGDYDPDSDVRIDLSGVTTAPSTDDLLLG